MKKSYTSIFIILGIAVLFHACDGQSDSLINERLENNPLPTLGSVGSADFSTFIAIGNSLSAGYMDGALYNDGQKNSYPALIAKQINKTSEAPFTFVQPDINSVKGFNNTVKNPVADTVFGRFKLDTSIPAPSLTLGGDLPTAYTGPQVHNFGVPGIQVGQLLTPLTGGPNDPANPAFNLFYERFASNPGTSTIIGDAVATEPTFFALWIGNNDILGYATSGGSNEAIFTSVGDFETYFNGTINQLITSTKADGIVTNIPFILGLPFFQAVPYNAIPLTEQANVNALNAAYEPYNNGLKLALQNNLITKAEVDRRTISFALGANAYVMLDESLTDLSSLTLPNIRQSEPTDLTLISAATAFAAGVGTATPAVDDLVLTPEEQTEIEQRTGAFNTTIKKAVEQNPTRLLLHDTNSSTGVFVDIFGISDGVPGITVQGVNLAPDFSPNGIFSTDAIHPNPRGHAIIANEMIGLINDKYGATIPFVSVVELPSVVVCGVGDCLSEQ